MSKPVLFTQTPAQSQMERMESIAPECSELKHAYDDCFNKWFSEAFLKGKASDADPCNSLLDVYQSCVRRNIEQTKKIDLEAADKIIMGTVLNKMLLVMRLANCTKYQLHLIEVVGDFSHVKSKFINLFENAIADSLL